MTFLFAGMTRLRVYTKVKPGQQLLLQLSRSHSDCISQLIKEYIRCFFLTVACRCTNIFVLPIPCQQLLPGVRTLVLTVGCQRLLLGEREHTFGGRGMPEFAQGQTPTHIQSNDK